MKTNILIFLAVSSIALAGCVKEIAGPENQGQDASKESFTFTVRQGDPQTRTILGEDAAIYWTPNDSIKVFYGSLTSGKFVSKSDKAEKIATFTGTFNTLNAGIEAGGNKARFWGVHPYNETTFFESDAITLTLPHNQVATAGTFTPGTFPSVAVSDGLDLTFYNVCGGIVFTVSQKGIDSITLKGNNDEVLAGTVCVAMDTYGRPVVKSVIDGEKEITVTAPDKKGFEPGINYYLVSLPVSFQSGFSIKYCSSLAEATFTTTNSISIKRSTFGKVLDKDKDLQFFREVSIVIPPDNEIWYTSTTGKIVELSQYPGTLVSNTYQDGKGVYKFRDAVTDIASCFQGQTEISSLVLPSKITSIPNYYAMEGMTNVNTIVLPQSLASVGTDIIAFLGGEQSEDINVYFLNESMTYGWRPIWNNFNRNNFHFPMTGEKFYSSFFKTLLDDWKYYTPVSEYAPGVWHLGDETVWSLIPTKYTIQKAPETEDTYTDLSASGTANSYIVQKAGNYCFNAGVKGNSTESIGGTPSTAEILWESFNTDEQPKAGDIIKNVSLKDGVVYFGYTGNSGNAAIAVKNSSGDILWSWHIWATEYDPSNDYDIYKGHEQTPVMDRNLGALSNTPGDVRIFGFYYQWGRKDPFPSSSSLSEFITMETSPSSVFNELRENHTVDYAIAHPTTSILENSRYDWLDASDNSLWGTSKTKYDPCPPGWRVPDTSLYDRLVSTSDYSRDKTNRGVLFGTSVSTPEAYFPCNGNHPGGSLNGGEFGNSCHYWTNSANRFCVYPEYSPSTSFNCFRSHGFPVRCCKE